MSTGLYFSRKGDGEYLLPWLIDGLKGESVINLKLKGHGAATPQLDLIFFGICLPVLVAPPQPTAGQR